MGRITAETLGEPALNDPCRSLSKHFPIAKTAVLPEGMKLSRRFTVPVKVYAPSIVTVGGLSANQFDLNSNGQVILRVNPKDER